MWFVAVGVGLGIGFAEPPGLFEDRHLSLVRVKAARIEPPAADEL